jgi:hypothetical protein
MLKRYFPLFFDLWKVKDKRHDSTNLLATTIDLAHRRIKRRHLNDATVRSLPLVPLQRRQFQLCPARVGSMHRLALALPYTFGRASAEIEQDGRWQLWDADNVCYGVLRFLRKLVTVGLTLAVLSPCI